ncbi:hypothetical protein LTR47_005796 [Exophiala xenobiotica]|nr:hypothetical protein LTR47_005796 [Exophiala xenobiotica]KAK5241039.1 hypothetical protein LTS06_012254 [Exophiala xenobiotica]KAK5260038.1 hypothetical protein LTR40_004873 [Exophiala xenobiotica]KAK5351026.1 hypothetical protein LTR61_005379 [Exophiala xenobiotica]KAK5374006.1 hypothetical protein LTS03_006161 [Exophiala xenobiotica]
MSNMSADQVLAVVGLALAILLAMGQTWTAARYDPRSPLIMSSEDTSDELDLALRRDRVVGRLA